MAALVWRRTEYKLGRRRRLEYRQQRLSRPPDHSNDGVHTLLYRSIDVAGNIEAGEDGDGADRHDRAGDERRCARGLEQRAGDGDAERDRLGGSGVATTEYKLDGAAGFTTGSSVAVTGQGVHTLSYRSVDVAGNTEADEDGDGADRHDRARDQRRRAHRLEQHPGHRHAERERQRAAPAWPRPSTSSTAPPPGAPARASPSPVRACTRSSTAPSTPPATAKPTRPRPSGSTRPRR